MFVYNYRLRDRYAVQVISLAVLADTVSSYRPDRYDDARWGCEIHFRFPVVKLLDWESPQRWQELEASDNVFALVVMAQIRAKATRDAEERTVWKFRLLRFARSGARGSAGPVFPVASLGTMRHLHAVPPYPRQQLGRHRSWRSILLIYA